MAIILISQGFVGVSFRHKPSVYAPYRTFAGPTKYRILFGLIEADAAAHSFHLMETGKRVRDQWHYLNRICISNNEIEKG